jgi:two-component system LytT family response regulator
MTEPLPQSSLRIVVHTAAGCLILEPGDIDWICGNDYYAAVHVGGRRLLLRETLAALEARLEDAGFLRVHRSAIVNIERVRELKLNGYVALAVRDGTAVPISRRKRALLLAAILHAQITTSSDQVARAE